MKKALFGLMTVCTCLWAAPALCASVVATVGGVPVTEIGRAHV